MFGLAINLLYRDSRIRPVKNWRKCMGIEPTWDAAQRPTPDLKSGRATSALSTSAEKAYREPIEQPQYILFYLTLQKIKFF